jgi:hypothetical protein
VEPRADLDDVEKRKFLTLLGLELRPLGRPVRSQSLYWLRYFGSPQVFSRKIKLLVVGLEGLVAKTNRPCSVAQILGLYLLINYNE